MGMALSLVPFITVVVITPYVGSIYLLNSCLRCPFCFYLSLQCMVIMYFLLPFFFCIIMNSTTHKHWKVLCWNVRGLNSDKKWDSIRDKIVKSQCDVICLQETKCEFFYFASLSAFAHHNSMFFNTSHLFELRVVS